MARLPSTPEGNIEHGSQYRPVNFSLNIPYNSHYEAKVFGHFTGAPVAPGTLPTSHDMHWDAATSRYVIDTPPNLEVGKNYAYQIRVTDKSSTPTPGALVFVEPGPTITEFAHTGSIMESSVTLSPIASTNDIRTSIATQATGIIEGLRNAEGAEGVEALFRALEADMNSMGLTGVHRNTLLEAVNTSLGNADWLAPQVRRQFQRQRAPRDFAELQDRLTRGSTAFRKKVFANILANKISRETLHLAPNAASLIFHNTEDSAVFDRICNENDLGSATGFIREGFESVQHVPVTNPALATRRATSLAAVINAIRPGAAHRPGFFQEVPPERWAKMADVLYALGFGAAGIAVAPALGIIGIGGKALLETTTGLSMADIMRVMQGGHGDTGLGKTAYERSYLVKMMTSKTQTSFDVFKDGVGDFFRRCVSPITSWRTGGKQIGETGHEEHPPHAEHGAHADSESIIRAACEREFQNTHP